MAGDFCVFKLIFRCRVDEKHLMRFQSAKLNRFQIWSSY